MIICIAGPYSADTAEQRQANFDRMNEAAAIVLQKGHIPLIGVNAALPVIERAKIADSYKAIMDISLAVIKNCDAILLLAESPGANRERDVIKNNGGKIFTSIDDIPNSM